MLSAAAAPQEAAVQTTAVTEAVLPQGAFDAQRRLDPAVLDRISDGYWEVAAQGLLTLINRSARRMLGIEADEDVSGIPVCTLFPDRYHSAIVRRLSDPSGSRLDLQLPRKGRTPYVVQMRVGTLTDAEGHAAGRYGVMKDVSEAVHARLQLQELQSDTELIMSRSNQMAVEAEVANIELRQVFNTTPDGMWILGLDHTVFRVNDAMLAMLGKPREAVVGGKCHEFLSGPLCHADECPIVKIQNRKTPGLSTDLIVRLGGRELPVAMNVTPFRGLENELVGVLVNYRDITSRRLAEEALQRANEELHRMATVDGLTGLCNRRHLDAALVHEWKRMIREHGALSVIICDVDFFKRYNDTYGHQMGDDCLKMVASNIGEFARRPADVAARYGGEEFAVLLPNTHSDGAVLVADQIRRAVQALQIEHRSSDAAAVVTLSVGVSTVVPTAVMSAPDLIAMADQALYEAKQSGRNRVVFKEAGCSCQVDPA